MTRIVLEYTSVSEMALASTAAILSERPGTALRLMDDNRLIWEDLTSNLIPPAADERDRAVAFDLLNTIVHELGRSGFHIELVRTAKG